MGKIKAIVGDIAANWKTPATGRYVSYKELTAYSVGGMGVQFIMAMSGNIAMSANSWLIGSIYGMKPLDLALILNIATIIGIVFQPIKSALIDNAKSKKGKSRPWIFWLGPPTAILVMLVAFIPMGWSYATKLVLIGTVFILLNIISNFYLGMYNQLSQLLSPNTNERAVVISISSIAYSLAPTITAAVMPLIASQFDDGLLDIKVYKIAFPIFCLLGVAISYFAYFGTKEKVITSKKYVQKVKFFDGIKKIGTNRYFWIINSSNVMAVFRGSVTTLMPWLWAYMFQDGAMMSLLVTIVSTSSLIGMLLGPVMSKLIGKKYTVIITNIVVVIGSIGMLFFANNIAMIIILMYLIYMATAVQIITGPAMNAEALDYQQWKTGDRLEGFSGNFSIITSVIAIGTNLVIPGLLQNLGLLGNYDVLFDPEVRTPIFKMLAVVSIVGSLGASIPYFFWNLNEKKHAQLIDDLKARAIAEDREAGFEETAEELEASLKGITVEALLAERDRSARNWGVNNGANEVGLENNSSNVFDDTGISATELTDESQDDEGDENNEN